MQYPEVSIIIPAYNEEKRIEQSIEKALDYLSIQDYSSEIIIVDDGSRDNTSEIVNKYASKVTLLKQPKNMGKGAAVRRGMLDSNGDIRIFTDADFSTPIYEVKKVIEQIKSGFDICIGSRAIDRSMVKEHQPFYREFMGKTFNKIVQFLLFKGIKDTQCGFKAFTKDAAIEIFSRTKIDGFSFDVEALYLARTLKYKISQVPVEWYNDDRSKVNPITDASRMFIELFRIKSLHK